MDYSKVFVPIDVSRDEIIKELIEQRNILQAKYDNMTVFANNLNDEVLKLQAKLDIAVETMKQIYKQLWPIAHGHGTRVDCACECLKEALAKLEEK